MLLISSKDLVQTGYHKNNLPYAAELYDLFFQHIKLREKLLPNKCDPTSWEGDNDEWFSKLFNQLKKEYPSLIVIDPKDVQCSGKSCKTDIDGIPVYRDVGHLSDYASYTFGKE